MKIARQCSVKHEEKYPRSETLLNVSFGYFSLRQRKVTWRAGAGEPHAANDVPLRHGWAATHLLNGSN
ncbi:MAG: hypothetical protein ACYDCJ_09870 [Gammaproteobacteria bacterium]